MIQRQKEPCFKNTYNLLKAHNRNKVMGFLCAVWKAVPRHCWAESSRLEQTPAWAMSWSSWSGVEALSMETLFSEWKIPLPDEAD